MNTLQSNSLSYRFRSKNLIENVSLTFRQGHLYTILGPNGSGKSTFLKAVCGIWRPTSGSVLWNAEDLSQKNRREISKLISFVASASQTYFEYSVEEVVAMGRYAYLDDSSEQSDNYIVKEAMRELDVLYLKERCISELSSGERQRVYLAQALTTEASVLLLDEPTSSLDVRHQRELWSCLKRLCAQGKIVAITTHDLAAAAEHGDSFAVMQQGRCVYQGEDLSAAKAKL